MSIARRVWFASLLWISAFAVPAPLAAAPLPGTIATHIDTEVARWLDEPRLYALLRESNERTAELDEPALAALEPRWQAELDSGSGVLGDRVASRFASKYFAEVVLRMDGAYRNVVAIDNQGVVVAACELPDHYLYSDMPAVQALADDPALTAQVDETLQDEKFTRVVLPVDDREGDVRLGYVWLEIDASQLARAGEARNRKARRKAR